MEEEDREEVLEVPLSLEQVASLIQHGHLQHRQPIVFSYSPDFTGNEALVLSGSLLHEACADRDGRRGQAKIEMVLEGADRVGLPRLGLAQERATIVEHPGFWIDEVESLLPMQVLAMNKSATKPSWELVCAAWPEAMFAEPGNWDWRSTALSSHMSIPTSPPSVEVLMNYAAHTEQGVEALLGPREYCRGYTAVHNLLDRADLVGGEDMYNAFSLLIQASPKLAFTTDALGRTFLHMVLDKGAEDAFVRGLLERLASSVSPEVLVTLLSTEREVFADDFTGTRTHGETPCCIIHQSGLDQSKVYLAGLAMSSTFPGGMTLLHVAAAYVLAPIDREEEVRFRENVGQMHGFPIPLPPEEERRGTKKLFDWLISVGPEQCQKRDANGKTPLHYAIETGKSWNNGIESLLVGSPASVSIRDPNGRLPLHLAIAAEYPRDVIAHLIRLYPGALVCRDPTSGLYPFMAAAASPNSDLSTVFELYRQIQM